MFSNFSNNHKIIKSTDSLFHKNFNISKYPLSLKYEMFYKIKVKLAKDVHSNILWPRGASSSLISSFYLQSILRNPNDNLPSFNK